MTQLLASAERGQDHKADALWITCCQAMLIPSLVPCMSPTVGAVLSTLARLACPSKSRCSLMCSSGKCLTKTRFTSLILKCSSGRAAIRRSHRSCVKPAFLMSIQPGTSSVVSKFVSLSWRVLMPSSILVMWSVTRSLRFYWSVFVATEHFEGFKLFLWALLSRRRHEPGHRGFDAPTVSVCFSLTIVRNVSGRGQQLLVIHLQTDALRYSLQATNQSRCNGPIDFEVLARLVQAYFFLVAAPATGIAVPLRKMHAIGLGLRRVMPVRKRRDRYVRPRISLRDH